ncbi:MAG: hypothetical protein LUE23_02110, partial [Lachnospiraceae bacterium]|nr:hypothetical protein [Lachnospiraceae bacterium]
DDDTQYPLVEVLGGLGSTNSMSSSLNGYAAGSEVFASEVNQASNPCYVLNFSVPYEACCSYEAELAYVNQFGEIAKWVAAEYGNVDENRIYATGMSQGAGWAYELAAVQPDLLAAILINAGMTTHSTWADQCDMTSLASSDVNIYIWHGYQDTSIPVNEAYRAYNDLVELGKTNIKLEVAEGGHVNGNMYSAEEFTSYMTWLFEQVKGVAFTDTPELTEEGDYADYLWAGYSLYESVDGWATENDYAHWTEPAENSTWETIQAESLELSEGNGGTGDIQVGRVRIACELVTTYDGINDGQTMLDPVVIKAGDSLAITIQGYTGAYGDDLDTFLEEWSVDYAVLSGSITNIEVTNAASEEPISRPDDSTASLTNGAGPNVNNSIATDNVLDGEQVYVRIDTAEDFDGETATIALRFTRALGNGEYASFIHVISVNVES